VDRSYRAGQVGITANPTIAVQFDNVAITARAADNRHRTASGSVTGSQPAPASSGPVSA
jgi:hypothetical protein